MDCLECEGGSEFRGRADINGFLATPRGGKCNRSPLFYAFGWAGGDSPSFAKAWMQGMDYIRSLCPGERPPQGRP